MNCVLQNNQLRRLPARLRYVVA